MNVLHSTLSDDTFHARTEAACPQNPPPAPVKQLLPGGTDGKRFVQPDEDLFSGLGTEALPTAFCEEVARTAPRFSVWKGLHGHVVTS